MTTTIPGATTPTLGPDGITAPAALLSAMLKWASDDEFRCHITGIGFVDGCLAATNGHVLVTVPCTGGGPDVTPDKPSFARTMVERLIGIARVEKRSHVTLPWAAESGDKINDAAGNKFPEINRVIPRPFPVVDDGVIYPVLVDPRYIGMAGTFGDAYRKLSKVETCLAMRGLGSDLDPIRMDLIAAGVAVATIVIMPFRGDVPAGAEWPSRKAAQAAESNRKRGIGGR